MLQNFEYYECLYNKINMCKDCKYRVIHCLSLLDKLSKDLNFMKENFKIQKIFNSSTKTKIEDPKIETVLLRLTTKNKKEQFSKYMVKNYLYNIFCFE